MDSPKRKLDNWIDAFLQYTDNTEPPYLFRKWTAISVIASALQRKCYIKWGTSLTWYPNLYVVLVGPSATGKGTAMSPGLDLLQDLGTIRLASNATSLQALIRRLKETNLSDPDMETGKMQLHSSMTIFSKEFTVFLGYHNRELMAALCDWYDCDRTWSYETISRKKEEIVGVWVNLVGGTTPDLIASSLPMDALGGGLTSRIIFIYEEKRGKLIPLPMQDAADKELYQYLLHDLEKIALMSGEFKYTTQFLDHWTDWCIESARRPPLADPKFEGYLGRRRANVMKLSMINSSAHGKQQLTMTRDDLEEGIKMIEEAENKMGMVFRGVGKLDISEVLNKVLTFLASSLTEEIPVYQFMRHFQGDVDKTTLDRIFETLKAQNVATIIHKPQADDVIKVLNFKQRPDGMDVTQ
jgi:hypothetical protein